MSENHAADAVDLATEFLKEVDGDAGGANSFKDLAGMLGHQDGMSWSHLLNVARGRSKLSHGTAVRVLRIVLTDYRVRFRDRPKECPVVDPDFESDVAVDGGDQEEEEEDSDAESDYVQTVMPEPLHQKDAPVDGEAEDNTTTDPMSPLQEKPVAGDLADQASSKHLCYEADVDTPYNYPNTSATTCFVIMLLAVLVVQIAAPHVRLPAVDGLAVLFELETGP